MSMRSFDAICVFNTLFANTVFSNNWYRLNSRVFTNSYWCLALFIVGSSLPLLQSKLLTISWLLVFFLGAVLIAVRLKVLIGIAAFILGLLLASWRFQAHIGHSFPAIWERQEIPMTIKVIDLPTVRGRDQSFRATIMEQSAANELQFLLGQRVQLSCYRCPVNIKSGDIWNFTVRLKRPHGYASPGAFDYEKYLFRQQVIAKGYVRLKSPYSLVKHASLWSVDAWRVRIKQRIYDRMSQAFTVPSAEGRNKGEIKAALKVDQNGAQVITALAIGDKSGFSRQQRQLLQDSGLSHLFAISGLHVGLVFVFALWVCKWILNCCPMLFERCPRQILGLLPALFCAITYSALAGFAVSTQRALLMLSIFVLTRLLMREVSLLKVLLISATLILLYDPFSILDSGFWLSCSAVLVIHLVTMRHQLLLGIKVPDRVPDTTNKTKADKSYPSLLRLQPALWFGMLPLTATLFGQVSLVSPLINLIAVPLFCLALIPITLFSVCVNEMGLSAMSNLLFSVLGAVYSAIFETLETVVQHPLAAMPIEQVTVWQWALFLLVAIVFRYRPKLVHLMWPVTLFILLKPGLWASHNSHQKNWLKLTLLDVGQGLSMVIQSPAATTVYDTGPKYSSGFNAADAVLIPYLRSQGIKQVDRLIVSHADNDHIGGYTALKNEFEVLKVMTSRIDKLPDAQECKAGQTWQETGTLFDIISPDQHTPQGSNNRSCVLRIQHNDTIILLTGDIEKQVERYLLAKFKTQDSKAQNSKTQNSLAADIMLMPHQGSKTSSTVSFIEAVSPKIALVAAGYLNHYHHPHSEVLERYSQRNIAVLSTIDSGTIELIMRDKQIVINEFRRTQRRFWHWRPTS